MTDKWDPSIPEHKEVAHGIEIGNGIPEMRPLATAREAIVKVGFEIEHEEDLADRGDPIPWYYPLEGDISKAQTLWDVFTVWRMSSSGKFVTHHGLWFIEKLGIVPKGTWEVGETLKIAADALVKSGREKVRRAFTLLVSAIRFRDRTLTVAIRAALHADVLGCVQEAPKLIRTLYVRV